MTIWVLLALFFIQGEPHQGTGLFTSQEACVAAQADAIKQIVAANSNEGSVTCTPVEVKIGTWS